jgi:AP-1 complex subunit gamma-1
LNEDITQEGLTLAATWVIGEFGDALLRPGSYEEEGVVKEVKESDIVDLFTNILNSSYSGQIVTQYIITSAMKLTSRLSDPAQVERIRRLLQSNQTNLDVEIQQRAVEYSNLFAFDSIRRGVLEKMPPPEIQEAQRVLGEAPKRAVSSSKARKRPAKVTEQDMLLDLMGGSDETPAPSGTNGSQNNTDLLMDLIGGPSTSAAAPPPSQRSNVDSIMGLFGNTGSTSSTPAPTPSSAGNDLLAGLGSSTSPGVAAVRSPPPPTVLSAYNKNGLQIGFQVQRSNAAVQVLARFRNSGASALSNVSLQAAVPKVQKLQLQSISSSDIAPGGEATQQLRVVSVNGVSSIFIRDANDHKVLTECQNSHRLLNFG